MHRLAAVLAIVMLTLPLAAQQPAQPPPTQAQQRPVFRGGTHFVRVDAYPLKDGKIVEGLTAADFEILEDGKPQQIESFDFIRFDTFTPDAVRRDPQSQREGFDLAADPRYRLFVIYLDMTFSASAGPFVAIENLPHIQSPLVNFLDRIIGPQDLYGFLTSRNSAKDLVLAQKTAVTIEQIKDLWRASVIDKDEADLIFGGCPPQYGGLKTRYRADQTYSTLTDLVYQLGSLRQERKNIIFASNLLPRWRPDTRGLNAFDTPVPRVGISEGRIVPDSRKTSVSGDPSACERERHRLLPMDFDRRYKQLLVDARRENVSFYIITPGGLQAPPTAAVARAVDAAYDDMKSLADETDGIAVVNTNDLNAGMKRIADDMAAYYVLGYYTTNTKFDGGTRMIKVRHQGTPIRARRQYRAPTEAEIAALATGSVRSAAAPNGPSPREIALAALDRDIRSSSSDRTRVSPADAPAVFRVRARSAPEPATALVFDRTERIRVEWPSAGATDRREARLLDRTGKPMPVDLPLGEDPSKQVIVLELPLAAFSRGDYLIELTAGAGGDSGRRLLAFRIR